jgi:predicted amidophosphoribosyltransferase
MTSYVSDDELVLRARRRADKMFALRKKFDFIYLALRSCAVCTTALPPIDLLCRNCWKEFGGLMNRGEALRQKDSLFPTYSLLTWTPQTEHFVKPLIYGFKGGRTIRAAEKLAALFLSERFLLEQNSEQNSERNRGAQQGLDAGSLAPLFKHQKSCDFVVPAPAETFDHSRLWAHELAKSLQTHEWPLLETKEKGSGRQKQLRQGERANRRFLVKEDFANHAEASKVAKRIVFADDVITTGSTAMAAYMAMGDPDRFEVWTLVARPRLAGK